jgi:hypothetical protein
MGGIRTEPQIAGTILLEETIEVSAPVEVRPPGETVIDLITDAFLDAAMREAFTLTPYSCQAVERRDLTRPGSMSAFLTLEFILDDVPVDYAFDLLVRSGSESWLLTTIDSESIKDTPTSDGLRVHIVEPAQRFTSDRVDIILKSNQAVAARTFSLERIWGGEIIFEDVPVDWQPY